MVVDASYENLSCLVSADGSLELFPEPFRMQKTVIFRIPYDVYVHYLLELPKDTKVILSNDINLLQTYAEHDHPDLYKCFLQDVAFAILKELSFAEIYKQYATRIIPGAFDGYSIGVSKLIEEFPQSKSAANMLLQQAGLYNYKIPRNTVSQLNSPLYQLAVVLYQKSLSPLAVPKMDVVWDA
jgi:hypothetical protein